MGEIEVVWEAANRQGVGKGKISTLHGSKHTSGCKGLIRMKRVMTRKKGITRFTSCSLLSKFLSKY